jgi:SAM-dependent methyltransferase
MANKFGGYEDQEFVAELYDFDNDVSRMNDAGFKDVDFFIDCSRKAGGRTLELGCGTGRVLIPTALAGCAITGLDISPRMLKKCREKLDNQPIDVRKQVRLIQGNMTEFDTGEMYDLITVPFRAFQHLMSVGEQKSCLICVKRHLTPQGHLVIDVFHPFPPRLVYDPRYADEIEDLPDMELPDGTMLRTMSRVAGFHRDEQYNDIELIYYVSHPDGRKERLVHSFPMKYLFRYEMEHLLELGGFRVVDLFGNFDRSIFSENSPEMIFVAEKK